MLAILVIVITVANRVSAPKRKQRAGELNEEEFKNNIEIAKNCCRHSSINEAKNNRTTAKSDK
jgi:hypothetical protein